MFTVYNDQFIEGRGVSYALYLSPTLFTSQNKSLLFMSDDESASAFDSVALPAVIDPGRLNNRWVSFSSYDPFTQREALMLGSINTLVQMIAVPEPSGWVMLVAGLAGMFMWTSRRSRRGGSGVRLTV
jgi:hypothetical protein